MAGFWMVAVLGMCFMCTTIASRSLAQDSLDPESGELLPDESIGDSSSASTSSDGSEARSVFEILATVGWFGLLLFLLLSVLAVAFIIEHSMTIRKGKMIPEHVVAELEQKISRGEFNEAIEFCYQPENYSLASEVILAGLERYQGSEFGFAEYKTSVEEAGENQTGRLYRKTEVLGVIGAISPMLGLTGTVSGMIEAFFEIEAKKGMATPTDLAGGIGTALITTLLGMFVAIPTMIAYSYFRNKIDSIVAEAGKRIERVMMPLGRKR